MRKRLEGLQRVLEELAAVEDAREPPHLEEALLHHLAPDPLHLGDLREEAVAPDVEQVAVVPHRPGVAAHLRVLLQHDARHAGLHQGVRGGEAGGSAADDDDSLLHFERQSSGSRVQGPKRGGAGGGT
jgi:hypothetical protein